MVLKDRSIVRDGNHFIWLEGSGWTLIDGPWFKMLEAFGIYAVTIPIPPRMSMMVKETDFAPTLVEIETYQWERCWWHPGTYLRDSPMAGSLLNSRWNYFLGKRSKRGWRIKPDGRLPLTLYALTLEQAQRTDWYL